MKKFIIEGCIVPERWDKKIVRELRNKRYVPAQVYGKGLPNTYFGIPYRVVEEILHIQEFCTFEIELNGNRIPAVLNEIQKHPITDRVIYMDFVLLREDKKYVIKVPLRLVGEPAGIVKGGTLVQGLKYIRLKCFPSDFVPYYEVDVSHLDLGMRLHVSDIMEREKKRIILEAPHLLVARVPGITAKKEKEEVKTGETGEKTAVA